MPTTRKEIKKYDIKIRSHVGPHLGANQKAEIYLYDADEEYIAGLFFYPPDYPLPENDIRPEGYFLVSYPWFAFAPIVDILRNEKPLFFSFVDNLPSNCYGFVSTTEEPVGEFFAFK